MIIPVLCSCGAHLRLSADDKAKKFVAVCVECDAVYELIKVELSDEKIGDIKDTFYFSDFGKTLSYMVKRVPQ